jgi:hypothetical protein
MRRTAASLLALGLTGCLLTPNPRPPADEGAWPAARNRLTRSGKLYDGLSTNAFARVVYLPRDLRDARVARIAAWKAFTVEETERLLVAERDDAARYEEFLLSLFTPTPADNDLDAPKSVWRVALVVPGAEDVLPESIQQVRPDAMLRALHPEIEEFYVVYRVRFVRQHALEGRNFVLRLAGAKGRLDFAY